MVNKYGARRVHTEEGWFDSEREHRRWGDLKLLERAGKIKNLRRQVPYELIPKRGRMRAIRFIADFVYEENGKVVVEDSKGYRNRLYMLKWRLMEWRHGIQVVES